MTKEEFRKYFNLIFAEFDRPTVDVELSWYRIFKDVQPEKLIAAIDLLGTKHVFGKPKRADLCTCLDELQTKIKPKYLTCTAEEACNHLNSNNQLVLEAKSFADRTVDDSYTWRQYESPEDLDKAKVIYKATWLRAFKARFTEKQTEANLLIRDGSTFQKAIESVTQERLLDDKAVNAILQKVGLQPKAIDFKKGD